MGEPFWKIAAGRGIFEPQIGPNLFHAQAPGPNPAHQDPASVAFFNRVVHAFDLNVHETWLQQKKVEKKDLVIPYRLRGNAADRLQKPIKEGSISGLNNAVHGLSSFRPTIWPHTSNRLHARR